jgi:hypothetical protein
VREVLTCFELFACLSLLQDRDAIVKGLKGQIKNAITQSGGQPQAKIMEPLLNQPTNSFEFAFKIRVSSAAQLHQACCGPAHDAAGLCCTSQSALTVTLAHSVATGDYMLAAEWKGAWAHAHSWHCCRCCWQKTCSLAGWLQDMSSVLQACV